MASQRELYERATELDISGRSKMSVEQLTAAIAERENTEGSSPTEPPEAPPEAPEAPEPPEAPVGEDAAEGADAAAGAEGEASGEPPPDENDEGGDKEPPEEPEVDEAKERAAMLAAGRKAYEANPKRFERELKRRSKDDLLGLAEELGIDPGKDPVAAIMALIQGPEEWVCVQDCTIAVGGYPRRVLAGKVFNPKVHDIEELQRQGVNLRRK